ncbi:MAG: hypothetical protein QM713_16040 [Arachnia sp.]
MNQLLKTELNGLVPERPDATLWGPSVRRKKARRRVAGGGAAVALVLGAAVALSTTLGGTGPTVAGPAPTTSSAPHPHPQLQDPLPDPVGLQSGVCAALLDSELRFSPPPHGGLPTGATRVWLCGDPESGLAGEAEVGPREPLVADPDQVALAYNELPRMPRTGDCPSDAGLVYRVVVEYPDGMVAFTGTTANCQAVGDRKGGKDYFTALASMWRAQRAALPADVGEVENVCRGVGPSSDSGVDGVHRSMLVDVRREDVTSGFVCGATGESVGTVTITGEAKLPDDVVADLVTAQLEPFAGAAAEIVIAPYFLVMLNEFGDPVVWHLASPDVVWAERDERGDVSGIWRPSESVKDQWYATLAAAGIESR